MRIASLFLILLSLAYSGGCSDSLISEEDSALNLPGGMPANTVVTGGVGEVPRVGGQTTAKPNLNDHASQSGGTTQNVKNSQSGGTPTNGGAVADGWGSMTGGSASAGANSSNSSKGGCVSATAVAAMKLGWNLGNSLDSIGGDETKWGNPKVTPALIQAVAKAGFGAIRIPVTWYEHIGSAPNYTIDPAWMNRVEEVVKYVLDQKLYAILNIHHDGVETMSGPWILLLDSHGQFTAANNAKVLGQFKKVWAQIADRFKNHNDHLIFESMNEIKVGYDPPKKDYYTQINALNQAFVETVRASSGNNPGRCLVVPGYNTNIEYTLAGFVTPNDIASGKLILSAHYYDPWNYAGMGKTHVWGAGRSGADNWGQEDWVRASVQKLKAKYIDKGIPVIWGEYGAVHQSGFENDRRYYMEYVTKAAHDAGIVPFFWDNGSTKSGEEAFGLFNRNGNSVLHPTILEAMMRAVNSSYSLANIAKP